MKFGSLFSGIGGFDLGFERAGMQCAWQCEIDDKCRGVLKRHWPEVTVYDDVRSIGRGVEPVDLICGGFPCQDLSVAGRRKGLAGERSGLWHEFARVLAEVRPEWCVIENVPGLLSSNKGRDFAVVLHALVELGYRVCWRVLDAQYFGLAQRRKRVFIVGCTRDGRAAEVLFEREGLSRHPPSRGAARQEVAGSLGGGSGQRGWPDDTDRMTFVADTLVARCLATGSNGQRYDYETETLVFDTTQVTSRENRCNPRFGDPCHPLAAGAHAPAVIVPPLTATGVRRLTPTECERLQGFPDGWTGEQADGPRYRQLGNAVAVPVAEWIGRRIMEVAG